MELKRSKLRWLSILGPAAFIILLFAFLLTLHPKFGIPLEHHPLAGLRPMYVWSIALFLALGVALAGVIPFSNFVFSRIQRQEEEILRRSEAMDAISSIGTGIISLLELDKTLQSVVEKARELLNVEASALFLTDERGCLAPKTHSGPSQLFEAQVEEPDSPCEDAKHLADASGSMGSLREVLRRCGFKVALLNAYTLALLRVEGEVIGGLCVADRTHREFSPLEMEILNGLATQAAVAIEDARLHEQLQSMILIEERNRIAREMHDGLAQDLGYLYTKFGHIEQMLTSDQRTDSLDELKELKKVTREAYEEVRRSILGLRSMSSWGKGLVPTVVEYLKHFENRTGISVELDVDGFEAHVQPLAKTQIVRIIQEALANVRKHSGARQAWLTMSIEGEFAKILIRDDGVGFDMETQRQSSSPSFGLETMQERAESIGGTITVASSPEEGTAVEVRLPLSR